MLKAGKEAEELEKIAGKIKELEEELAKEQAARKDFEEKSTKLAEEKNSLFTEYVRPLFWGRANPKCVAMNFAILSLESTKGQLSDSEDRLAKLQAQKNDLDRELAVRR